MALNFSKIPNWVKVILTFLGTLSLIAINGILGNRADAGFLQVIPLLYKTINIPIWISIVVLLSTVFPLLIACQYYYKAHQIATKLNKLDETLLLLLPKLYVTPDINEALKRLLEEFLSRTIDLVHLLDGCGIAVYGPDHNDRDYLTTWCQLESPNENKEKARFYVGNNPNQKRGVAGNTFVDKTRHIVHLVKKNGEWQADNHEYIFLVDSRSRRRAYTALITVPIIGDANESLGVLCLYSNNITAFDSTAVQDLLSAIAGRLSAAMLVARTYQIRPAPSI
ncbi:GAF domain-containing protein [Calothrix sp. FACHB-156]|nr:GAF domain-containing protein [Calothrix sp. FACHB-156]